MNTIKHKNIISFNDVDLETTNYNLTFETIFNGLTHLNESNKKQFIIKAKQELTLMELTLKSNCLPIIKEQTKMFDNIEIFLIVDENDFLGIIGFVIENEDNNFFVSEIQLVGLKENNYIFAKCFFILLKQMLLKYNKVIFNVEDESPIRKIDDRMVAKMNGKITINKETNMVQYLLRNEDKTINCQIFKNL
jgi:hypothetical protein